MSADSPINDYFDRVYCLNLKKRGDRMDTMRRRFQFTDLRVERFNAIDGEVMRPFWKALDNPIFANPAYVACALSHLAIYREALDLGCKRILIIEDDNRIHRRAQEVFGGRIKSAPEDWDLLHLAFIPLSDDLQTWDYNILDALNAEPGLIRSKNLWSLMCYGISEKLMRHLLEVYDAAFPMELDRYFVSNIMNDPGFVCRAVRPQLFCAEDNYSDNTQSHTPDLLKKSVDTRFAAHSDYV